MPHLKSDCIFGLIVARDGDWIRVSDAVVDLWSVTILECVDASKRRPRHGISWIGMYVVRYVLLVTLAIACYPLSA